MSEPNGAPTFIDLVAALPDPAIVLRRDGTVVAVNDAFLEEFAALDAYGETVAGARLVELTESLDATVLGPLERALACERLALRGALLWKHGAKQGERFDVLIARIDREHSLVTFRPTGDDDGQVAERRRLARLECLGIATSGVAHDLNNHLAAAMNVAMLLGDELGVGSPHDRALEIILGSTREAAGLARKLLAFAGRGQPEIERLDLKQLVQDAALLVRHELPSEGRLTYDFRSSAEELHGDATQVQHAALLALLLASRRLDAASCLRIASDCVELREPLVSAAERAIAPGRYATLRLEYAPAGAPAALDAPNAAVRAPDRPDPPDEVLATIDAIAFEHGGGARFARHGGARALELFFALSRPPARRAHAGRRAGQDPASRVVLVADDDAMVRDVAVALIGRLGYRTLTASGGREAIETVRRADPRIDLVVLDLVMADVDGASALREIRRVAPQVKVIVSSGYGADSPLPADLFADGMLEKPYSIATLDATLVRALDG